MHPFFFLEHPNLIWDSTCLFKLSSYRIKKIVFRSHPPFSLGVGAAAFSLRSILPYCCAAGGEQRQLWGKLFQGMRICFESVMFSDRSTSDLIFCPIVCLNMSFCLFCQFCLIINPSINLLKVNLSVSPTFCHIVCLSQNVVLLITSPSICWRPINQSVRLCLIV